ncbi:fibronectin type III-like domain-contianing protein [Caulobacter segnis]
MWPAPVGGPRRLAAFRKTEVAPGKSRSVSVAIDPRLLATFDDKGRCWRVSPGSYKFELGGSSSRYASQYDADDLRRAKLTA